MATSSDSRDHKRPPFNPEAKIVFTEAPDPSWRPGDGLPVSNNPTAKAWKEDEEKGPERERDKDGMYEDHEAPKKSKVRDLTLYLLKYLTYS